MEVVQFVHKPQSDTMRSLLSACHDATERLAATSTPVALPAQEALGTIRTHLWVNEGDFVDVVALTDAATEAPLDPLAYSVRSDAALEAWGDVENNTTYLDGEAENIGKTVDRYLAETGEDEEGVAALRAEFDRAVGQWVEYVGALRSADAEYDYDEYDRWWYENHQ